MSTRFYWTTPSVLPWIILSFAALNVIFLGGKRRAFGVFVADFKTNYKNISLAELNWIGDSYSALGYMTIGLSISMIIYFNRRYGLFQFIGAAWILLSCLSSAYVPNPHWLFLTHTLFHGIGSSIILSIAGLIVNEYFDKNHPHHILATTLVSGGSVASIIFVSVFAILIQKYGWSLSFIILGVVYFLVIGTAALFFRKNKNFDNFNHKKSKCCEIQNLSKTHGFLLSFWFMDRVMTSIVTYGMLLNLTDFSHRHQSNLVKSSVLTTLFASGEAVTYLLGAIITAITKDFFKDKLRYILLGTSILMSVCLILLEFLNIYPAICYILCFLAGFALGPSITFLFPAGEELTRLPGHVAYPISLGGMGFGMMISPLLTAKIAEMFNYNWFFLIQGGLICVKAIFLLAIIIILFYNQNLIDIEEISKNNENDFSGNSMQKDESWPILTENENK